MTGEVLVTVGSGPGCRTGCKKDLCSKENLKYSRANIHININIPTVSWALGVEYFFICSRV
jgi:hypothetical protein